ncbi:hypothetical protein EIP91_002901 [Steccherinum ochraceum]|uniref:SnoaL-like domain-containing protein n=1 Tax=Steccherinum ochraceum TaxID=92696 RepID=A0A4R0RV70_9APHY|nr:hypothetical protein EIP91_002901 [Steccherinum ochraceum]
MPIIHAPEAAKNPSSQLRAVLRWLDALTTSHDADQLMSVLTDDYTHHHFPKSTGLPSYKKLDFVEYAQRILMPALAEYNTTILKVIENEDQVVVHIISDACSVTGNSFTSELMMFAHVVPQLDGEFKIKTMSEFIDSDLVKTFYFAEVKRIEAVAAAKVATSTK